MKKFPVRLNSYFRLASDGACSDSNLGMELMQLLGSSPHAAFQASVVIKGGSGLETLSQNADSQDKFAVFDPLLHGGEAMQDPPQGVEFGTVLIDRNVSNL